MQYYIGNTFVIDHAFPHPCLWQAHLSSLSLSEKASLHKNERKKAARFALVNKDAAIIIRRLSQLKKTILALLHGI
jgi:hypothetical protein